MKPTIGTIVMYNTSEKERNSLKYWGCNTPKQLPAIVTAICDDACVNLRVIADGLATHDFWAASIYNGNGEGEWNWGIPEKQ